MPLRPRTLRLVTRANRREPGIDLIDGIALGGVDPTTYALDGRPLPGDERWEANWNGASWWFRDADRREQFLADPERWAPQFGGHCAVGRATGVWVDGDPREWHLEDGRLYLNKNRAASHLHGVLRRRIHHLADELAADATMVR